MDEFLEDFEREGVLSALTKSPAGMFLDPLKIGAQPDRIEQRVSDELDPETKQRIARSVELARKLRKDPLISAGQARLAGDQALSQQAAAQQSGPAFQQGAIASRGAGLGSQILGRFGGQMAQESTRRFGLANRLAGAQRALESGQALAALQERIKNEYAQRGLQLSTDQAQFMAARAIASQIASMQGQGSQPQASSNPLPFGGSDRGAFPVSNSYENVLRTTDTNPRQMTFEE